MKDHENLTVDSARYVKGWTEMAMRKLADGQLGEVFNCLSKLQLDCLRRLENQPQRPMAEIPANLFQQRNKCE